MVIDGSFAENFYGLKRARVLHHDGKKMYGRMSLLSRYGSLLSLVVLPYWRSKLKAYYDRLTDPNLEEFNATQEAHMDPGLVRIRDAIRRYHPYVHALIEGSSLAYLLSYMFEYSDYPSPSFHLLGLHMRRLSMRDIVNQERRLRQEPHSPLGILAEYFKVSLLLGILAFKLMEWWSASESQMESKNANPVPPAPPTIPPKRGYVLPSDRSLCPLCHRKRSNPACTPTGYAFCYPCIASHLATTRSCPVTGRPLSPSRIRSLFLDEHY